MYIDVLALINVRNLSFCQCQTADSNEFYGYLRSNIITTTHCLERERKKEREREKVERQNGISDNLLPPKKA